MSDQLGVRVGAQVEALREAADAFDALTYAFIPDDFAEWLRARANALEGSDV